MGPLNYGNDVTVIFYPMDLIFHELSPFNHFSSGRQFAVSAADAAVSRLPVLHYMLSYESYYYTI